MCTVFCVLFFFFKQKTAYELRISDWSSDVCSSDLLAARRIYHDGAIGQSGNPPGIEQPAGFGGRGRIDRQDVADRQQAVEIGMVNGVQQIGRASCRERVCQYV